MGEMGVLPGSEEMLDLWSEGGGLPHGLGWWF